MEHYLSDAYTALERAIEWARRNCSDALGDLEDARFALRAAMEKAEIAKPSALRVRKNPFALPPALPPEGAGHKIPCLGYWSYTDAGREYTCGYENAAGISCDDCLFTGGDMDPRTGERA